MYTIDERLRGLPANRDQIVAVYQSINQPNLMVPGKKAGPAQAFIVGLRGSAGLSIFVYLHLPQTQDCAVYVPERRNLSAGDYAAEESEAHAFVESMGFMMDNLNFRALPAAQQDQLLKTLPVFLKDPRLAAPSIHVSAAGRRGPPPPPPAPSASGAPAEPDSGAAHQKLGRLFASF